MASLPVLREPAEKAQDRNLLAFLDAILHAWRHAGKGKFIAGSVLYEALSCLLPQLKSPVNPANAIASTEACCNNSLQTPQEEDAVPMPDSQVRQNLHSCIKIYLQITDHSRRTPVLAVDCGMSSLSECLTIPLWVSLTWRYASPTILAEGR